ncbi:MAG: hypothetical protein ACT4NY_14470 [Pseudonocardiales bacterium]
MPTSRHERGVRVLGVRPFALTALRHPTVSTLLDDHRALLADLLDGLGSPLHVVLPEIFEENVAGLRQAFAEAGADADILFAKKVNKADCYVCETVLRCPSRSDSCCDWPVECLGIDLSAGLGEVPQVARPSGQ